MIMMSRMVVAALAATAFLSPLLSTTIAEAEPLHGLSVFGELKYPADFQH